VWSSRRSWTSNKLGATIGRTLHWCFPSPSRRYPMWVAKVITIFIWILMISSRQTYRRGSICQRLVYRVLYPCSVLSTFHAHTTLLYHTHLHSAHIVLAQHCYIIFTYTQNIPNSTLYKDMQLYRCRVDCWHNENPDYRVVISFWKYIKLCGCLLLKNNLVYWLLPIIRVRHYKYIGYAKTQQNRASLNLLHKPMITMCKILGY